MESTRRQPAVKEMSSLKITRTATLTTTLNVLAVQAFDLLQQGEIVNKEKTLLTLINQLHCENNLDVNIKHFLYACTYSLLAKQSYYDKERMNCANLEVTEEFAASIPDILKKSIEHIAKVRVDSRAILDLYKVDVFNLATLFNIGSLCPDIVIEYIDKAGSDILGDKIGVIMEGFQYHSVACKNVIGVIAARESELQTLFMAVNRKPILFLSDFLDTIATKPGFMTHLEQGLLSVSIELYLCDIEREFKNGHISEISRHFLNTLKNVSASLNHENFFRENNCDEMKSETVFLNFINKHLAQPPKARQRNTNMLFQGHSEFSRPLVTKALFIRDLSDYLYTENRVWKVRVFKFITYTTMPPEIKKLKKILKPTRYRDQFIKPTSVQCDAMFEQIKPLFEEFTRPYTGRDDRHVMIDRFLETYNSLINEVGVTEKRLV